MRRICSRQYRNKTKMCEIQQNEVGAPRTAHVVHTITALTSCQAGDILDKELQESCVVAGVSISHTQEKETNRTQILD
jgi:hypothetical protein